MVCVNGAAGPPLLIIHKILRHALIKITKRRNFFPRGLPPRQALDQGQEPEASSFRSGEECPFVIKKSPADDEANRPSAGQQLPVLAKGAASLVPRGEVVRLFQRVVDRSEHGVEVGAQAIHSDNDSDRDAGRDKTVFDGCGARLVSPES